MKYLNKNYIETESHDGNRQFFFEGLTFEFEKDIVMVENSKLFLLFEDDGLYVEVIPFSGLLEEEIIELADAKLCELFDSSEDNVSNELFIEDSNNEYIIDEDNQFIENTWDNIENNNLDVTQFSNYNHNDPFVWINQTGKSKSVTRIEKEKIESGKHNEMTSIGVSLYLKEKLDGFKRSGDSFEDVILRLIEFYQE